LLIFISFQSIIIIFFSSSIPVSFNIPYSIVQLTNFQQVIVLSSSVVFLQVHTPANALSQKFNSHLQVIDNQADIQ
jgi:hypothetical protein